MLCNIKEFNITVFSRWGPSLDQCFSKHCEDLCRNGRRGDKIERKWRLFRTNNYFCYLMLYEGCNLPENYIFLLCKGDANRVEVSDHFRSSDLVRCEVKSPHQMDVNIGNRQFLLSVTRILRITVWNYSLEILKLKKLNF